MAIATNAPASALTLPSAKQKLKEIWTKTPPSLRFALPVALLFAVALAIYLLWGLGESFVALQVHHSFKSAELKVLVDGSVKHTASLSGTTSRKVFSSRTVGLYSKNLSLRPGRHTIEVRISAPGVEQSRSLTADFTRDSETVLEVSSVHAGLFMSLRQPAPHDDGTASGAIRSNPLTSMLFTVGGSVLSAVVGFYVQQFLRQRSDHKS